jgi:NitT/TauT family transport system substrate-binding protein
MTMLATRGGFGPTGYIRLPLGPREEMAAALRSGAADAIVAHEPDASFYESAGAAFELLEITSVPGTRAALGDTYPTTALYFPEAFIAEHPDEVGRLVAACLDAMQWLQGHDGRAIVAALPAKMVGSDPAAFAQLVDDEKRSFVTDGRLPVAAARSMLAAMAALQPKYADVRIEQTYTDQFIPAARP